MASVSKPNPIPDSYRRITPCLIVQGGDKALKFYAEVFAATERMRYPNPDGTVAHAEIEIGDSVLIVEEQSPEQGTKTPPDGLPGSPAFLYVCVEDVDDVVARAVKLGAHLQRPPAGPVLRRPRGLHHRPVRSWVDHCVACGGRGTGGADAADGRDAGGVRREVCAVVRRH
jgi:PhnB protein